MDYIVPSVEDWHAKVVYLEVSIVATCYMLLLDIVNHIVHIIIQAHPSLVYAMQCYA